MDNLFNIIYPFESEGKLNTILNDGIRNTIFIITKLSGQYVVRVPKKNIFLDPEINYANEKIFNTLAFEYKIDNSYVSLDSETGWRVSHFIKNARVLDISSSTELNLSLKQLKKLHQIDVSKLDLQKLDLLELYLKYNQLIFENALSICDLYYKIYEKVFSVYYKVHDSLKYSICHFDCHEGNFIFDEKNNCYLIDYERSKLFDARYDVASLVVNCNLNYHDRLQVYQSYYDTPLSLEEINSLEIFCILSAFYNLQWSIYMIMNGYPSYPYMRMNTKFLIRNMTSFTFIDKK